MIFLNTIERTDVPMFPLVPGACRSRSNITIYLPKWHAGERKLHNKTVTNVGFRKVKVHDNMVGFNRVKKNGFIVKSSQQIRLFEIVPTDQLPYYIRTPFRSATVNSQPCNFVHVLLVRTIDVESELVAHVT